MISTFTNAGLTYIRNKIQSGSPPDIKHFVLANVPNVMTAGLNADSGMPDQSRIVHKQDVTRLGKIDADTVVFSLFMGADVGNFVFNWIGLLASDNTLIGFSISGEQNKYKNAIGQNGNNLRRNIVLKFDGAAETLSVKIPAATWQQDISHLLDQKIDKTSISDKLDLDDPTKVSSSKAIKVLKDGLDKRITKLQQWHDGLTGSDADNVINRWEEIVHLLRNISGENIDLAALLNHIDAGRIDSGTLDATRIPNLDAGKINSGTLNVDRIPNLDASKISKGVLSTSIMPDGVKSKRVLLWKGFITGGNVATSQSMDEFDFLMIDFDLATGIKGNSDHSWHQSIFISNSQILSRETTNEPVDRDHFTVITPTTFNYRRTQSNNALLRIEGIKL